MIKDSVQTFAGIVEGEKAGASVNPYELLPHSKWIPPTMAYISSTPEGLIKSVSVFCYNLRIWHQHEGLTFEETCAIFRAMKNPHRMAELNFGENKHYAMFAGLVAQVCKHRRMRRAAEERKIQEQMVIEERRNNPEKLSEPMERLMESWKKK